LPFFTSHHGGNEDVKGGESCELVLVREVLISSKRHLRSLNEL
jgi:hypothetical protein